MKLDDLKRILRDGGAVLLLSKAATCDAERAELKELLEDIGGKSSRDTERSIKSIDARLCNLATDFSRRLAALESYVVADRKDHEPVSEEEAVRQWFTEPWPDPHISDSMKCEAAFRAGFKAGRG